MSVAPLESTRAPVGVLGAAWRPAVKRNSGNLYLNVSVDADLTVKNGHEVAKEVRHQILHHVPHITGVTVHVDPVSESGEAHHRVGAHAHDGLPLHSHG